MKAYMASHSSGKRMTLANIIPNLDSRELSRISGKSSILSVIAKLEENRFEPLLVEASTRLDPQRPLVVSGYSLISKLAQLKPTEFAAYLESPAFQTALAIGTIDESQDLLSLFHVFESTTFGYAEVRRNRRTEVMVTVKNLLKLYNLKLISCNLQLDDVASSPVFSLSRGAKLEQTLREMLNRKFRRVQIAGTKSIVSDREILSYLFQEARLKRARKTPERLLDGTLEDVESRSTPWVDGKKNLIDAASLLSTREHDSLLTDRGIVTPWDLIIKPWRIGELRLSD